jgi:hypothetical protein
VALASRAMPSAVDDHHPSFQKLDIGALEIGDGDGGDAWLEDLFQRNTIMTELKFVSCTFPISTMLRGLRQGHAHLDICQQNSSFDSFLQCGVFLIKKACIFYCFQIIHYLQTVQ